MFHVSEFTPNDSEDMVIEGLRALRHSVRAKGSVSGFMAVCSSAYSLPVHGLRYLAALPG